MNASRRRTGSGRYVASAPARALMYPGHVGTSSCLGFRRRRLVEPPTLSGGALAWVRDTPLGARPTLTCLVLFGLLAQGNEKVTVDSTSSSTGSPCASSSDASSSACRSGRCRSGSGWASNALYRLESGDQNMTIETLCLVAEALGMEAEDLIVERRGGTTKRADRRRDATLRRTSATLRRTSATLRAWKRHASTYKRHASTYKRGASSVQARRFDVQAWRFDVQARCFDAEPWRFDLEARRFDPRAREKERKGARETQRRQNSLSFCVFASPLRLCVKSGGASMRRGSRGRRRGGRRRGRGRSRLHRRGCVRRLVAALEPRHGVRLVDVGDALPAPAHALDRSHFGERDAPPAEGGERELLRRAAQVVHRLREELVVRVRARAAGGGARERGDDCERRLSCGHLPGKEFLFGRAFLGRERGPRALPKQAAGGGS